LSNCSKAHNMKCMVIGLDGASYHLIRKWCDRGYLPNLGKFMSIGVHGILKSTIPANTCPALPAFYTGKNPAKTGIFDFIKPDGSLVTYKDVRDITLWSLLDFYGYKQCVAGLRVAYPPPKINGIFISGIVNPLQDSDFVHPPEKKEELKDFYPSESFNDEIMEMGRNRTKNKYKLYKYLYQITKNQVDIFRRIILQENPHFALLWIGSTDDIQHYFWDDADLLLRFFKDVDEMVGELVHSFPDTNTIIMSDHGFGEAPKYEFYLNTWLFREGYLKIKWNKIGFAILSIIHSLDIFKNILPLNLKKLKFSRFRFDKLDKSKNSSNDSGKVLVYPYIPGIDYSKSQACFGTAWGIKILRDNVDNYEQLREELIEKLKELKGVEGEKLMKEVWRREEIYYGKYENEVPDIIFVINDKYLCRALLKRKIFSRVRKREWVGNHDSARDGIFIAYGRDIKSTGEYIGEIQIYDLMPTILHMYGVPIPEDVDGRVLNEIFREESEVSRRKPKFIKMNKEKIIISSKIKMLKKFNKLR